jgi:hypothetical protein
MQRTPGQSSQGSKLSSKVLLVALPVLVIVVVVLKHAGQVDGGWGGPGRGSAASVMVTIFGDFQQFLPKMVYFLSNK